MSTSEERFNQEINKYSDKDVIKYILKHYKFYDQIIPGSGIYNKNYSGDECGCICKCVAPKKWQIIKILKEYFLFDDSEIYIECFSRTDYIYIGKKAREYYKKKSQFLNQLLKKNESSTVEKKIESTECASASQAEEKKITDELSTAENFFNQEIQKYEDKSIMKYIIKHYTILGYIRFREYRLSVDYCGSICKCIAPTKPQIIRILKEKYFFNDTEIYIDNGFQYIYIGKYAIKLHDEDRRRYKF